MKRIIEKPGDFEDYIHKYVVSLERVVVRAQSSHRCAAAIAMRIAYGYRPCPEGKDHVVDVATAAMRQADQVFSTPYLVDIIPWSA